MDTFSAENDVFVSLLPTHRLSFNNEIQVKKFHRSVSEPKMVILSLCLAFWTNFAKVRKVFFLNFCYSKSCVRLVALKKNSVSSHLKN